MDIKESDHGGPRRKGRSGEEGGNGAMLSGTRVKMRCGSGYKGMSM